MKFIVTSVALSALLAAAPALALTTTVGEVLTGQSLGDLRQPVYYGMTSSRFRFDAGDTVDLTMTFAGGTPLTLPFAPLRVTITLYTGQGILSAMYTVTGSFNFIDPVGPARPGSGPTTQTSDGFPIVAFAPIRTQPGMLTFSGIHSVFHLDAVGADYPPGAPVASQTFGYAEVGLLSAIPEPATWALLVAGFGAVGLAVRRQRPVPAGRGTHQ